MENPATTTSNRTTGKLSLSALPGIRQQMEQILYRFYDEKDNLLYVGISNHFYARASEHTKNSGWMKNAVRATFEHYPDKDSVAIAEKMAIIKEKPLFNKRHNSQYNGSNFKHFLDIEDGLYDDDFHMTYLENFDKALEITFQISGKEITESSRIWAIIVALRESNLEKFEQCQTCLFILNSELKDKELAYWSRIKGAFMKGKKCR